MNKLINYINKILTENYPIKIKFNEINKLITFLYFK